MATQRKLERQMEQRLWPKAPHIYFEVPELKKARIWNCLYVARGDAATQLVMEPLSGGRGHEALQH